MPEIGQTFSHFKIVEKIGEGGMGTVFLAEDLTLDRKVALKFLPGAFTSDPERMARFEREAKLLASLNHPNIAGIHGLEQADGNRFLVLEYVEGENLQARLSKGALPLEEALALCRQIAEGLEAAHEKGIIHRDLKPANVMITAEDEVKILDFGLAKALLDDTQSIDSSQSPTITEAMTRPGVILGTAAYMSPEQAKGKSVDKRADIWAFGCILYECLTGKKAFEGETVTETLAAIIRGEPDWDSLLPSTPRNICSVLRRCLEKEKSRRLRDAGDVQLEIEETGDGREYGLPKQQRRLLKWKIIAAVFIIAFISVTFIHFRENNVDEFDPVIFQAGFGKDVKLDETGVFSLSPNGRQWAFDGTGADGIKRIWLRSMDSLDVQPLIGTETNNLIVSFFWSPDSLSIAFIEDAVNLKKINVSGGPATTICKIPAGVVRGGSWSKDGEILLGSYPSNEEIVKVSTGGTISPLTKLNKARQDSWHGYPTFLPDGRHFIYFIRSSLEENTGVYIGSLDSNPEDQNPNRLIASSFSPLYVPSRGENPGEILYVRGQTLMVQPFNENRMELIGNSLHVIEPIGNLWFHSFFSVSNNGVLLCRPPVESQITWIDREGRDLDTIGRPGSYPTFDLSKDAKRLVMSQSMPSGYQNLWVTDLMRDLRTRLTQEDQWHVDPRWLPDSRNVIYGSTEDKFNVLMQVQYSSSDPPKQVHKFDSLNCYLDDVSPDGKYFLYHINGKAEVWASFLAGDGGEPRLAASSLSGQIDQSQFSPDGRWIAYNTDESGRNEVVVVPFPPTGEKYPVSKNGGMQPTWRGDGRELYFLSPDGWLMAIDVRASEAFDYGEPMRLFKTQISPNSGMEQYAPHPEGKKFLFVKPTSDSISAPFTVVLNWTSLIKQ